MDDNLKIFRILSAQGKENLFGEVEDVLAAVTPDLPSPQTSLFLREGDFDVVLRLLVSVNSLEILLGSFKEILEFFLATSR